MSTSTDAFPAADHEQWRQQVDRVLDKSGELDADALNKKYEKVLVTNTYDGLRIDPLYTPADTTVPPTGMPGQAPFVRGSNAAGAETASWQVRQSVRITDATATNDRVLSELERGTTQILLDTSGVGAIDVDLLDGCLEGVYLDLATFAFDAGAHASSVVDAYLALAARRGVASDALQATFGIDPIGAWLRSGGATDLPTDLVDAGAWAQRCLTELPNVVPFTADGSLLHEAGGGDVEELGGSIALGLALLRSLVDGGVAIDDAAPLIEFRYAATPDQFLTIAKLRAARRLWQRVTSVAGASESAQRQKQHAVSSTAATARYDVWVNLLRSTVASFGAGVGGADAVTVHPHDELLTPGGSAIGQRMARNAQLVLIEESNLAQVADMAGGSWYVESLTDQLAEAGWKFFQELEDAGGVVAAAESGLLQDRLALVGGARAKAVATRRHPLTGLSEFPDIGEDAPTPQTEEAPIATSIRAVVPRRYSQPLEDQRARADELARAGTRPEVFLVNLGTPAVHTARATFAKNMFEVGGIRAVSTDGFEDPAEAAAAFAASGAPVACICSSDDRYREQAVAVAHALRSLSAPPQRLYLAGKPTGLEDELEAAGVDELIVAGADVLDVLSRALDLYEASAT